MPSEFLLTAVQTPTNSGIQDVLCLQKISKDIWPTDDAQGLGSSSYLLISVLQPTLHTVSYYTIIPLKQGQLHSKLGFPANLIGRYFWL